MAWMDKCESKEERDFFTKKLLPSRSTFGTLTKTEEKPVLDDGFAFAFKNVDWNRYKPHGELVGRPKITRNLGTLQKAPGPGAYDDKDELRSKLTTAPAYSLQSRTYSKWFSDVNVPGPGTYESLDSFKPFTEKKGKLKQHAIKKPKCKVLSFIIIFLNCLLM